MRTVPFKREQNGFKGFMMRAPLYKDIIGFLVGFNLSCDKNYAHFESFLFIPEIINAPIVAIAAITPK